MREENSVAGQLLSGKESDRAPKELAPKTKHDRIVDMTPNATTSSVVAEKTAATKCDDNECHDEFVSDVLARFGIQI
jgi:hypothetical protein